jgi:F420-dependent oxidoreductase-like protein
MTSLNAGLVIPRGSAREFVARVQQAEERGLRQVWTTAGGPTADTVTSYAAAAVLTERIGLSTSIVPTYPRHPITLASQAIAIEDLAPGRLRLGIGPSHRPTIEGSYGLPMGQPLVHLREYLTILRDLLWDGSIEFSGTYFMVKSALPASLTPSKTPLLISALRANSFRLAGELADGAITWLAPIDYLVATALPALQEGAEAVQRARPPLIAHVPVAVTTDRAAARQAFRSQFGSYGRLPFYAAMFAAAGFPVSESGQMSAGLVDALTVSGDVAEIKSGLEAIRERGIDELLISQVVVADQAAELEQLSAILAE